MNKVAKLAIGVILISILLMVSVTTGNLSEQSLLEILKMLATFTM